MKSSPQSDERPALSTRREALALAYAIGDTTWRMFIPTIGLTIVGLVIDNHYPTKPWATVAGVVVGAALATWLVRRQLAALRNE